VAVIQSCVSRAAYMGMRVGLNTAASLSRIARQSATELVGLAAARCRACRARPTGIRGYVGRLLAVPSGNQGAEIYYDRRFKLRGRERPASAVATARDTLTADRAAGVVDSRVDPGEATSGADDDVAVRRGAMTEDGGAVYWEFIGEELRNERERRAGIEARAGAVITQSGTLVTLLLAATAFVKGQNRDVVSSWATGLVILSIVFLVGAAISAIMVSFAEIYPKLPVADKRTLTKMGSEHYSDPELQARGNVAYLHIDTLEALRRGNERKVDALSGAHCCQVLGLAALAAAVLTVIMQAG
jgi:hypothetical protein